MELEKFINQLDEPRIVAAIAGAEKKTSGEIRLFVSSRKLGTDDIRTRAAKRFEKLGMTATRHRNGVLLYFLPNDQKFVIFGDTGIHQKCGEDFWTQIAQDIQQELKSGNFTASIVHAITKVGEALKTHFPIESGDQNELPNSISSE